MAASTLIPTAALGRSGPEISRVGLGCWLFGGQEWGRQDDRDSVAAMRRAFDLGVSWLDTAAVYGRGHSEEVVGRWLRELSEAERPLVFTKCGLVWDDTDTEPRQVLAPASIRRECDASLQRVGLERIDLYQCHWPSGDGTAVEESWATMAALVDEGKVRWIGVSNYDVAMLEACERIRHVDSLQPPFNLLWRDAASELLPWCTRNATGVIVYSALAWSLLSGSFTRKRLQAFGPGDWRADDEEFRDPKLGRTLALVERLGSVAKRHHASVAEVAVAWILSWPGVTGAIAGARTADQVAGWVRGPSIALGDDVLDEIAAAIAETGAGSGPARPPVGARA